jgi:hypothetical protein
MRFVDGLTLSEIKRALHLRSLSAERVSSIIAALRSTLGKTAAAEGRLG